MTHLLEPLPRTEKLKTFRLFGVIREFAQWWLYVIEMTTVVAVFQYVAQRTENQFLIIISYANYAFFLAYLATQTYRFAMTVGSRIEESDGIVGGWRNIPFAIIAWGLLTLVIGSFYVLPFVVVPAINAFASGQAS